jgi:hypothetical protein
MVRSWPVIGGILVCACLHAQAAGGAEIGVKGGLVRASVPGEVWSAANGFEIGGFFSLATGRSLALQPEVIFVRRAMAGEISDGVATIRSTTTLDYVEVPVLLKYTFHRSTHRWARPDRVSPMVFGGAFAALRTGAMADAWRMRTLAMLAGVKW